MILVMNALMKRHAFAKYGIWYSEWLGQRAAGTEQVHAVREENNESGSLNANSNPFSCTDSQYLSHITDPKQ